MKTENVNRRKPWLPTLLISWNLFDLVVHVAIDMAEPLRIAGNVVAIVAAIIVLFANVKSSAPYILSGAAVVVLAVNVVHASQHGALIPMLVFIGVTLFLLLRWAQDTLVKERDQPFYLRWWVSLVITLVAAATVFLSGMTAELTALPVMALDDIVLDSALLEQANITPGPNDTDLYTTVNAAEHADYARSHIFEYAIFGGSLDEDVSNRAIVRATAADYPGAYNVVTRNSDELFVYYGVYGEVEGATGPAVAHVDANTLEEVWNTQLADYRDNETAWNYPGVIGLHGNGTLIIVSGNTAAVIDPDTGDIINQVDLPQDDPALGSYNGFATTSDGTLFTKALFRNCDEIGSTALARCLDTEETQTLLALDPVSLEIITQVELPVFSTGRIPIAVHDGVDYVYMPGVSEVYRYRRENQALVLDQEWGFVSVIEEGDLGAMAPNIIGDWAFVQVNTGTDKPMPVWAISTRDSSQRYLIQPFDDIDTRFSFGVAHGAFDTASGLLYTADTGTGYVAAMSFDPETGFEVVWREEQTTSVFQQLIGTADERVVVTSDLVNFRLNPLTATNEHVVFRDAATGRELARTGNLPRMSQGANISPGFGGRMYFPGVDGRIYEVSVQSE